MVTRTGLSYCTEKFQTLKPYFGTLKYLNTESVKLGRLHPLLQSGSGSVRENTRIPRNSLMTGTYILQSNRSRFSGSEISPIC